MFPKHLWGHPVPQPLELSQAKFYLVPQQKLSQPRELAGPVPTPAAAAKQCIVLTKEKQTTASSSPNQAGTRRGWAQQTPREPDRRGKAEEGVTVDSQAEEGCGAGKDPGRPHHWVFFRCCFFSSNKIPKWDKGVLRGFSSPSASLSLPYPQVT